MLRKRKIHFEKLAEEIEKQRGEAPEGDTTEFSTGKKVRRVPHDQFMGRFNKIQEMQAAGVTHWAHGTI